MSSISALSPNTATSASGGTGNAQQIKNDFTALATAMQSGNLSDAQQAFAALKQDAPSLFQTSSSSSSTSTTSAVSTALNTLGTALQSGSTSNAQQAFTSLQQTLTAHHHRGHHSHAAVSPSSTDDESTGFSAVA